MYKLNGVVIRKLIVALHFVMKARKIHGYITNADILAPNKLMMAILSVTFVVWDHKLKKADGSKYLFG
jgi:hypothetical protein